MRILVYIFLILATIVPFAFGASFTEDEFNGSSVSEVWTTDGDGSFEVTGGNLEITTVTGTFTRIYQTGITGDFDVMARIGGASNTSDTDGDIPASNINIQLMALIDGAESTDSVTIYQNVNPAAATNEHHVVHEIDDFPYADNTEMTPSTYWCYRIARVSGVFYAYYNAADDCSGGWTEAVQLFEGTPVRLENSGSVTIGLRAWDDGLVFVAARIVCTSGGCTAAGTLGNPSGTINQ